MVEFYKDYSDEPKDTFQPLTEQLGCQFYNLEMNSITEDISIYKNLLPSTGSVLELGCGSGRIADKLATENRVLTGIDLCLQSLTQAIKKENPYARYVCMDMLQLAFINQFTAIIVPYNTLNLLTSKENIFRCLLSCKTVLQSAGQFLAQIYIPPQKLISHAKKNFQFQIFNLPGGGKLIKEVLKKYIPDNQTLEVEERYRVRPMQDGKANEDWNRVYTIAAFSPESWIQLFTETGFRVIEQYRSYGDPATVEKDSTCLFIHLQL